MPEKNLPSSVETIKLNSNYLRGSLAEELANDQEAFGKDAVQLIKHHGMYQQDDRDVRIARPGTGQKPAKQVSLMVRVKVPGGRMKAEQLLGLLDLADELAGGDIRLTNRQDIQIHRVPKRVVREAIRRVNGLGLTTLGACGDVERNVLCCPAPLRHDPLREQLYQLSLKLTELLLPRSPAYPEIWMGSAGPSRGPSPGHSGDPVEPLYGKAYLPRKFKTAVVLSTDNCIDVCANDIGLVGIVEDGAIAGYNLFVGGGFGVTPSNKNTFAAVAKPMAFITPEQVEAAVVAVVEVERDFGNRSDRKRARLKYLIADWGLDGFRQKVEEYLGVPLADPRPVPIGGFDDHMGWYEQGDGRWFYGLNVENGRVADRGVWRLKTAVRALCRRFNPGIGLTGHQSLLFTELAAGDREAVEAVLREHGVPLTEQISTVRRWSMACVALPTCPLAVTESERVFPGVIDQLEQELERLGLSGEVFTTRMTGCPNGCGRPYNAELGFSGRTVGKYAVYLGGSRLGDRLAFLYKDLVPLDQLVPTVRPVLEQFRDQRQVGESFGDFCRRIIPVAQ